MRLNTQRSLGATYSKYHACHCFLPPHKGEEETDIFFSFAEALRPPFPHTRDTKTEWCRGLQSTNALAHFLEPSLGPGHGLDNEPPGWYLIIDRRSACCETCAPPEGQHPAMPISSLTPRGPSHKPRTPDMTEATEQRLL